MEKHWKICPPEDFAFLQGYDGEISEVYFASVLWLRLDRKNTVVDKLYNESDEKKFLDPIAIDAYSNRNPRKRVLTKFGFDTARDVLVVFSNRLLDRATAGTPGLNGLLRPDVGDRFVLSPHEIGSELFEIAEVHAHGRFGNMDLRFQTACTGNRVREDRVVPNPAGPAIYSSDEDIYRSQR